MNAGTPGHGWVCHRTNTAAPIWDSGAPLRIEKTMTPASHHPPSERPHEDRPNDFFIIDAHLRKARASSEKASRLDQRGQHREAIVQNKLTRIFIHNALVRLNRQCEAPHM